jgi:hypothetical protein
LAINSLRHYSDRSFFLTLKNLPDYMQSVKGKDEVMMRCIDQCKSCALYRNGEIEKDVESFLEDGFRVYRYDIDIGTREIEFTPYFDDNQREFQVCFEYKVSASGIHSEMLMDYDEQIIAYPSLLGKVKTYDSIEEFIEQREAFVQKVIE